METRFLKSALNARESAPDVEKDGILLELGLGGLAQGKLEVAIILLLFRFKDEWSYQQNVDESDNAVDDSSLRDVEDINGNRVPVEVSNAFMRNK